MGRPREFDENEVLTTAGELFWSQGYGGASTRDLTERTGLTPASMYNAFGDKRGLYIRSLEHYLATILHERIVRLEALGSPARAIAGYFREVIDRSLSDPEHRGCMLVNTALAATPDDPELQRLVANEAAAIERFFRRQILAGQKNGEIPKQQSADDLARMLLAVVFGLRVLVRVRPDAALLEGMVRPALTMLDIPWPRNKRSAR